MTQGSRLNNKGYGQLSIKRQWVRQLLYRNIDNCARKEELKYSAHELLSYSVRLLSTLQIFTTEDCVFGSLHASEETNRLPNATIKRHESTIPTGVMRIAFYQHGFECHHVISFFLQSSSGI